MRYHKSQAIILKRQLVSAGSKANKTVWLIYLLSKNFGLLRVMVSGLKAASKSGLSARQMQMPALGELIFTERLLLTTEGSLTPTSDFYSFDLIQSFQVIRENLPKLAVCYVIVELLLKTLEPYQLIGTDGLHQKIFNLTEAVLSHLEKETYPSSLELLFQYRLLQSLGVLPNLDHCGVCFISTKSTQSEVDKNLYDESETPSLSMSSTNISEFSYLPAPLAFFSPNLGGLVCHKCQSQAPGELIPVYQGLLLVLQHWRSDPLAKVFRYQPHPILLPTLRKMLNAHIRYHLEFESQAANFLKHIRAM